MADNDDLVSNVKITGTEESIAKLDAYAAAGEKSFNKVNAAAKAHGDAVAGAGKDVAAGTAAAAAGVAALNAQKVDAANAKVLGDIEKAAAKFGNELRKTVKDVAEFTARVTALAGAGVAAGAAILKLASGVAKQAQSSSNALDKQTESQINSNNAGLQATQGAINYEAAQRKLFQQFQNGAISNEEYQKSLRSLRQEYNEQKKVAAQLAAAQESVRIENERLKKSADDKKAFDKLVDTWGGPMLTSLISLGNGVNALFEQFKQAFGPAVAGLLDVINAAITRNSGSIGKFFDTAAARISAFVSQSGPQITAAIEGIGAVLGGIFNGIIEALPTMVTLFNNVFLPVLNAVGAALTAVANGLNFISGIINTVFGTNIPQATAGVIALTAALLFLTGGFKVMLGVIQVGIALFTVLIGVFGIVPVVIGAIAVALGLLLASLDWAAFAASAQAALQSIIGFFQAFPAQLSAVWASVTAATTAAWTAIVQAVITAWNVAVAFFAAVPEQLKAIFDQAGAFIAAAFNTAVTQIKTYLQDLQTSAMSYLQPIIDALKSIIALGSKSGSAGGDAQGLKGGGSVWAKRGAVRGAGTSTSDSIAAWLSNNEFVMRAKAVAKYGRDFMQAINAGTLDPSKMLGFAAGGLVQSFSQPRVSFAGAIPTGSSGRTANKILNLTIGNEHFDNLLMPDDVADRMQKFAVNRQSASAGRKPSWDGGGRR